MEYSTKWLRLRKVEEEYFTCRYDFMQNEEAVVNDLKKALTKAYDKETALRLVLEIQPSVTLLMPLLPAIVDIAVNTTGLTGIGLARSVLIHYKNELRVKEGLKTIVDAYLPSDDEWHYRRIAELYKLLSYKEELNDFLVRCQASSNWEIREIADDFSMRE